MRGDFQLGDWLVRPQLEEIRRGGEQVHLKRKALEVLAALARRPRETVSKEELFEEVWQGAFVTDEVLSQAIFELRKALGDSAQQPRFIQTVPRRGYRLVAPVTPAEEVSSAGEVTPRAQRRRPLLWAAVGAGALLALGVIGPRLAERGVPEDPRWRSPPRLAVLPLHNPQADEEERFFADGMTEALITELAQLHGLEVIARTSVMRFRDSEEAISEIARQLRVDVLIEGAVARAGEQVRVTVQLIDGASEGHLWAEHYDRPLEDVLGLQRELAHSIAGQVGVTIAPEIAARPPGGRVDPEAYLDFLRGVHLFDHWSDLTASERFFERAIARDPSYAPAHSYLARTLVALGVLHARPSGEVFPRARQEALRAIELDPLHPEGHVVLGGVSLFYDWDFTAGREALDRSLELSPNNLVAHDFGGYLAMLEGEHEASLRHARRALELDPFSHYQNLRLVLALTFARRYDEALAQAERTSELYPRSRVAGLFSAGLFALSGKCEAGFGVCDTLGASRSARRMCAKVDAVCGRPERARGIARELEDTRPVSIAAIYALLGDADDAVRLLRQAYRDRSPDFANLRVTPYLDPLRDDPRFQELLEHLRP